VPSTCHLRVGVLNSCLTDRSSPVRTT
jgi:hypothetical protein